MAQYISKIKTNAGELQIDYNALANKPDYTLESFDISVEASEINSLDGVTSNVQEQLDNKVSKSGDTIGGNLTIESKGTSSALGLKAPDNSEGKQAYSRIYKNASATADYGTQIRDYAHGGNDTNTSCALMIASAKSALADKIQFLNQVNGTTSYYSLYGEHNKPELNDIGIVVSDTDLTEGVSELDTGKLYFVYE